MTLLTEQKMTLAELAEREGVSHTTARRWCCRGISGVRLETILVGGRRFTSSEAFERFVGASTKARAGVSLA
jgi:predicted site-specific integrase-resolvase